MGILRHCFLRRPVPSACRLAAMLLAILLLTLSVFMLVAQWWIGRNQGAIAQAVVHDDLEEYAVIYERSGLAELRQMFIAGDHGDTQGMMITERSGEKVLEKVPAHMREYGWDELPAYASPNGEHDWHTLSHPVRQEDVLVGRKLLKDGKVLWFARMDTEDRIFLKEIRRQLLLAGGVAVLVGMIPIVWFSMRVMRPVRRLIDDAKTLAPGAQGTTLKAPDAIPELREFAEAFNVSLERTRSLLEELRSANDQLAHELRTPLMRIRGNLESVEKSVQEAASRDAVIRAMDETDRAAHLIQTILAIRSGDNGVMVLRREPCSLREFAANMVEIYQPAAEEAGLDLRGVGDQDARVMLDRQRFQQAAANLLDNAINYTPKGGRIEVEVRNAGQRAELCVRDTGPGIAPGEEAVIWERFRRGSAAGAHVPGLGLGLSLVRAIMRSHGGEASARNRPEGGAEFILSLPAL
jgi:signal transduction histidine kinase/HAMP domain-containing protein